eukprot:scaffold1621_cov350-Prasinococcus_capsulatus_cf.AAC.10
MACPAPRAAGPRCRRLPGGRGSWRGSRLGPAAAGLQPQPATCFTRPGVCERASERRHHPALALEMMMLLLPRSAAPGPAGEAVRASLPKPGVAGCARSGSRAGADWAARRRCCCCCCCCRHCVLRLPRSPRRWNGAADLAAARGVACPPGAASRRGSLAVRYRGAATYITPAAAPSRRLQRARQERARARPTTHRSWAGAGGTPRSRARRVPLLAGSSGALGSGLQRVRRHGRQRQRERVLLAAGALRQDLGKLQLNFLVVLGAGPADRSFTCAVLSCSRHSRMRSRRRWKRATSRRRSPP